MGNVSDVSNLVYRDYVTVGVPASGANQPVKSEIRSLFQGLDRTPFFILASGQSNFTHEVALTWTPNPLVKRWNHTLNTLDVGTAFVAPPNTTINVVDKFASDFADITGRPVFILNVSIGGQRIAGWLTPVVGPDVDVYTVIQNNIAAALFAAGVNRIDAFLWWQGESDTGNASYVANFETMMARFIADTTVGPFWFPSWTPVLIYGIAPTSISTDPNSDAQNQRLIAAAGNAPDSRKYVYTGSLPTTDWLDTLHMNAAGYIDAGKLGCNVFLYGSQRTTYGAISGLGTAATYNIGTVGGTVPLLNAANSFTGNNSFAGTQTFAGAVVTTLAATTFNGNHLTAGTYTLTGGSGKTLTFNNTVTFNATDGTTMTFPSTSATIARTDAANTFTGTQTVGALVATTVNGNTVTTGTGVLTLGASKTLTVSNTLTFTGTDGSSAAFGAGGTVAYVANKLSVFAATTSAELAGVLSDEVSSTAASPKVLFGTAGNLPATATNDSATAGSVGEYVESVIVNGSAISVTTTAVAQNVTSISLTAGDWDVQGVVAFKPAATTTISFLAASISSTTNTLDSAPSRLVQMIFPTFTPGGSHMDQPVPPTRFSLSGTTTIYLVGQATFGTSTLTMYGSISARRVR